MDLLKKTLAIIIIINLILQNRIQVMMEIKHIVVITEHLISNRRLVMVQPKMNHSYIDIQDVHNRIVDLENGNLVVIGNRALVEEVQQETGTKLLTINQVINNNKILINNNQTSIILICNNHSNHNINHNLISSTHTNSKWDTNNNLN